MNDDNAWKNLIAVSIAFLAFCIGFSACQYTGHRMELEAKRAGEESK